MLHTEQITWAYGGPVPGYGDINATSWAIAVPGVLQIVRPDGPAMTVPQIPNWIALSEGGQVAYQGHEDGVIHPSGVAGYGQHAFLWVGETLRTFADVETYQATAGGWAYVKDDGSIENYGDAYARLPVFGEHVDHGGITVGQGHDGDLLIQDGSADPRVLAPGEWFFVRFRLYGSTLRVLAVSESQQITRVWTLDRADIASLPVSAASASPPPSNPVPNPGTSVPPVGTPVVEVPPVSTPGSSADNPKITSSLDPTYLTAAVSASWTGTHGGAVIDAGNLAYWVQWASTPAQFSDGVWRQGWNRYGEDRMSPTNEGSAPPADGDLPAVYQPGAVIAPPVPVIPPAPVTPPVDLAPLEAEISSLTAEVADLAAKEAALEAKPAAVDPTVAHKGDPVQVTGSVDVYGLKSKTATWTGKIE